MVSTHHIDRCVEKLSQITAVQLSSSVTISLVTTTKAITSVFIH